MRVLSRSLPVDIALRSVDRQPLAELAEINLVSGGGRAAWV
jgi:hypothetical protein